MGIDEYRIETRQTHPQYGYETRPIPCPDGITRLVTFTTTMWGWFDEMTSRPVEPFDETIEFCWNLAMKDGPETGEAYFVKLLHYKTVVYAQIQEAENNGKSIVLALVFNGFARPQ